MIEKIEDVCKKIEKLALDVQNWNGKGNKTAFSTRESEIYKCLCEIYNYNLKEYGDPKNFRYGKLDQDYVAIFVRTIFSIRWKYDGVTGEEPQSSNVHKLYDMFTWDMGDHCSSKEKYADDVKNRPNEFSKYKRGYLCAPWSKNARSLIIGKSPCPFPGQVFKTAWEYMRLVGNYTSFASNSWSTCFNFEG